MPKRAISITLNTDNLTWLRAQAGPDHSVSRIVDELVSRARGDRWRSDTITRSVAGTVRLRDFEPEAADREVRALFDAALGGGKAAAHERRARFERKQSNKDNQP